MGLLDRLKERFGHSEKSGAMQDTAQDTEQQAAQKARDMSDQARRQAEEHERKNPGDPW